MDTISLIIMIIGALNWGLVGLLDFNAVSFLCGAGMLARIIYTIVGLAGIWGIVMLCKRAGRKDD